MREQNANEKIRVAIVGCGLIGRTRAANLADGATLSVCCDVDISKAKAVAAMAGAPAVSTEWKSTVSREDVDAVIVCTTHNLLAPMAQAAASAGKHVLIEKPGACRAAELSEVKAAAEKTGVFVRIGFNHRYHRSFRKAREIYESGAISDLLFIRARYGHGGRVGYEREWRAIPEISGGGEAIDQGMHLIDLARWFLGDLSLIGGSAPTYFWNMSVEDNAFFLLENKSRKVAFLHASWTEWKNTFSFEICGQLGKLEVRGLGGSYGTERLTHYQMTPEMGPPQTTIYEYPMLDNSWAVEIADFIDDIRLNRQPQPGIADAEAALRTVEQLYARSRS